MDVELLDLILFAEMYAGCRGGVGLCGPRSVARSSVRLAARARSTHRRRLETRRLRRALLFSPMTPLLAPRLLRIPPGDTVAASIGGARTGAPDIILLASIQADEVRFATQPQVRVRFCWAGDTLTVVRRDNLPRPIVAGTTYRNVFVAVELLGRLNAECLMDRISTRTAANPARDDSANLGSCAFLGASAAGGQQPVRSPSP
jgi:hypothetical protein